MATYPTLHNENMRYVSAGAATLAVYLAPKTYDTQNRMLIAAVCGRSTAGTGGSVTAYWDYGVGNVTPSWIINTGYLTAAPQDPIVYIAGWNETKLTAAGYNNTSPLFRTIWMSHAKAPDSAQIWGACYYNCSTAIPSYGTASTTSTPATPSISGLSSSVDGYYFQFISKSGLATMDSPDGTEFFDTQIDSVSTVAGQYANSDGTGTIQWSDSEDYFNSAGVSILYKPPIPKIFLNVGNIGLGI